MHKVLTVSSDYPVCCAMFSGQDMLCNASLTRFVFYILKVKWMWVRVVTSMN